MRKLRRFYPADTVREMYGCVYDPNRWPEHRVRIERTITAAQWMVDAHHCHSVADYSCGDGAIAKALHGVPSLDLKDIGAGNDPIEVEVTRMLPVDLFICTETIEHLEAPWTVLEHIANTAKYLVLSTPLDESPSIGNYEHYWSFDETDVATMLHQAGFRDYRLTKLEEPGWTYTYQLWTARSEWTTDRVRNPHA